MHNDHYTKLADYEPFNVYEAWAGGNKELFRENYTLGGYYLATLKYLARIESKDDPIKNLEKVAVYVQAMINLLKTNQNLEQTNEWHDYSLDVQPERGRWIEWSKEKYPCNSCPRHPERMIRACGGGYTRWDWDESRMSRYGSKWGWDDFKEWGQWRYVDEPKAQENV